jgi:hypothetical protein
MDALKAFKHTSTWIPLLITCALILLINANNARADNGLPLMIPTKSGTVKGFIDGNKRFVSRHSIRGLDGG